MFHNEEPIERSSPYSVVSAPAYRGGEDSGGSRSSEAMVGSRPVGSGLGSTRPNTPGSDRVLRGSNSKTVCRRIEC